jgi:hypothetical protein
MAITNLINKIHIPIITVLVDQLVNMPNSSIGLPRVTLRL